MPPNGDLIWFIICCSETALPWQSLNYISSQNALVRNTDMPDYHYLLLSPEIKGNCQLLLAIFFSILLSVTPSDSILVQVLTMQYCTVKSTSIRHIAQCNQQLSNLICQNCLMEVLSHCFNIVVDRFKTLLKLSCTDLSNYVQMDWKNNQECKNNESHWHSLISRYAMKIVFIGVYCQ